MNRIPEDAIVVETEAGHAYHVYRDGAEVVVTVGCHVSRLTTDEVDQLVRALSNRSF